MQYSSSVARERQGNASARETGWLRSAVLSSSAAGYAERRRKLDGLRAEWLELQRNLPYVMVTE